MIYKALKYHDPLNTLLYKYFITKDNWNRLDSLYRQRLSARDSTIQYEIDLLENEIQMLLSRKNYNQYDLVIIENIKTYYSNGLMDNRLLFTGSPIYNEECCINKIFDDVQKKIIEDQKKQLQERVKEYIQKYVNGEALSSTEKEIMFFHLSSDYLSIKDKENRNTIESIIKVILNPKKINDYNETKFLLDYVNRRQCYILGYDRAKLYLDYMIPILGNNNEIERRTMPGNPAFTGGVSTEGIIVINTCCIDREKLNNVEVYGQSLIDEIVTTSHESMHTKQFVDTINNMNTKERFAEIVKDLLFCDWDFYMTNYDFVTIEYQANCQGYNEVIRYINRYVPDSAFKEKQVKIYSDLINELNIVNAYAMVLPKDNSTPINFDIYVAQELTKMCKSNPKYVKSINTLQLFFHKDGNAKNFDELVDSFFELEKRENNEEFDYPCDYDQIFIPFFINTLDNYNLDSTVENNIKNAKIQRILKLITKYEARQLVIMISGYKYFSDFERNHLVLKNKNFKGGQNKMILERLRRIKRYMSYIKDESEVRRITAIIEPVLSDIEAIEKTGKIR